MSPTFALLLLTISPAQSGPAETPLAVRLAPGQELRYRGSFVEESPARYALDFEALAFVLDANVRPNGYNVAFLTVLHEQGSAPAAGDPARLELATVDARGRMTLRSSGAPPLVPLNGPPTLEPAGFVELPAGPVGSFWDVADGRRPPREWRVEGVEFVQGRRCLKLIGVQQSAAWDQPSGTALAWRRRDVVWLSTQDGTVLKGERTVERRGGGRGTSARAVTSYELESSLTYYDQHAADVRREVDLAWRSREELTALLAQPKQATPQAFGRVLTRIAQHLAQQPATKYRLAVRAEQRRAEDGRRGELPPPETGLEPPPEPVAVGRLAPDVVAADLLTGATVRLVRWRGRPVVLALVRTDPAAAALDTARSLQAQYGEQVRVAVLAGREVAQVYAVDTGVGWVVADADGVIRHLGDGGTMPQLLQAVEACRRPK
jgi:hypothetical protein